MPQMLDADIDRLFVEIIMHIQSSAEREMELADAGVNVDIPSTDSLTNCLFDSLGFPPDNSDDPQFQDAINEIHERAEAGLDTGELPEGCFSRDWLWEMLCEGDGSRLCAEETLRQLKKESAEIRGANYATNA